MTNSRQPEGAGRALLPAGLQDGLPPEAAHEAAMTERLVAALSSHGYERVKPPLLEFEDSLLAGPGAQVSPQTFRLMDPVSQRMMGLRADMTPQVARIAASRLGRAPRPLRLCYAGEVLRVRGNQLRPERQFAQVGAELLGSDAPAADAEVVLLAAEALRSVGLESLSIDLSLPTVVGAVLQELGLEEEARAALRAALDRKDAAGAILYASEKATWMALEAIQAECPALRFVSPLIRRPDVSLSLGRFEASAPLEGVSAEYHSIRNLPVGVGRPFSVLDIERRHPVQIITSLPEMLQGFETIHALAGKEKLIVAGHDPDVASGGPLDAREVDHVHAAGAGGLPLGACLQAASVGGESRARVEAHGGDAVCDAGRSGQRGASSCRSGHGNGRRCMHCRYRWTPADSNELDARIGQNPPRHHQTHSRRTPRSPPRS